MSEEQVSSIIDYNDDLADAEAPSALPSGDYPFEIVGAKNGISQNSGKPRVEVELRISAEDFPADFEDAEDYAEGMSVKTYIPSGIDKPSRFRMRKFCEAVSAPMGKSLDLNDWIGRKGIVTLAEDSFEGVPKNSVKRVEAL